MSLITAAQCNEAAELLAEREEALYQLARMRKAKTYCIAYGDTEQVDSYGRFDERGRTKPTPISATIRKLIQAETEEQMAAIDAKLLALGVQPPSAPEAPG